MTSSDNPIVLAMEALRLERALFPQPTDPEIRQQAVDYAVDKLASGHLLLFGYLTRQEEQKRLQLMIELNKDD